MPEYLNELNKIMTFDGNLEWVESVAMDINTFNCSYFFNNQEKQKINV